VQSVAARTVAIKLNDDSLQIGSLAAHARYRLLAMKFAGPRAFRQSGGLPVKHSDTMPPLSRRSFIAASAAFAAAPALRGTAASADVDVAIIGAGAAGIAAGRRVAAAKASFALIEAGDRVGGRCVTDGSFFGVPFDRGAHWIHDPDGNPVAKLAQQSGLELYPAPRGQVVRVGPRNARDAEMENFLSNLVRAHRAIADFGRARTDIAAVRALPRDLGNWRATIEFVLGPYACSKDLSQVSTMDLARVPERDKEAFCRQGYGTLLAQLAVGLPVQLATPAERIEWDRNGVAVATSKGTLRARAAVVTVSANVLAASKIEFKPELPKRQLDAAASLSLGSYDHIALEMPGNPLDLQRDDLVFEQSTTPRTAALLANVSGTDLHLVEIGGSFGRELAEKGEGAMIEFAGDWLASLFGSDIKRAIKRGRATRWNNEPWILGAMSVAAPNAADARRSMMESVGGRVWFAGEAVHEMRWGTVDGAWESGMRAAEAALRRLGMLKRPEDEPHPPRRKRPQTNSHQRRRRRQ
jgi:monoamine oxidase